MLDGIRQVRLPAALLAVAALAAIAVAACGGSPTPSPVAGPPTPTAVPTTASSGVPTSIEVTAQNIAFTPTELVGPAGVPFTFTLNNRDAGIPHNILIRVGVPVNDVAPNGPDLFVGEIVTGPTVKQYDIPALPAGVYTFSCQVHPNMVGTLTLR